MLHARHDYNKNIQCPDSFIPKKEPVFLLRSRDRLFIPMLKAYITLTSQLGDCDPRIVKDIEDHITHAREWQKTHPPKTADIPPPEIAVQHTDRIHAPMMHGVRISTAIYTARSEAYLRAVYAFDPFFRIIGKDPASDSLLALVAKGDANVSQIAKFIVARWELALEAFATFNKYHLRDTDIQPKKRLKGKITPLEEETIAKMLKYKWPEFDPSMEYGPKTFTEDTDDEEEEDEDDDDWDA